MTIVAERVPTAPTNINNNYTDVIGVIKHFNNERSKVLAGGSMLDAGVDTKIKDFTNSLGDSNRKLTDGEINQAKSLEFMFHKSVSQANRNPLEVKAGVEYLVSSEQYSISKAVSSLIKAAHSGAPIENSYEKEVSDDLIKRFRHGQANQYSLAIPQAFLNRHEVLSNANIMAKLSDKEAIKLAQTIVGKHGFRFDNTQVNNGTIAGDPAVPVGGEIASPTYDASLYVNVLYKAIKSRLLGAQTRNISNDVIFSVQSRTNNATNYAENANIADTGIDFTTTRTNANRGGTRSVYSWQIETADQLGFVEKLMFDMQMQYEILKETNRLLGTGSGQPVGIASTVGTNSISLSTTPTSVELQRVYTYFEGLNFDMSVGNWGWLLESDGKGYFEQTYDTGQNTAAIAVAVDKLWRNGMLYNMPAEMSNILLKNRPYGAVPANIGRQGIFGDWRESILFDYLETFLTIDNLTLASQGATNLTLQGYWDHKVIRPNAFAVTLSSYGYTS